MRLIRFCQMKRKEDNMMRSVNDDLLDDLEVDSDDLILDDFHDLEIEQVWILILEICYDEYCI